MGRVFLHRCALSKVHRFPGIYRGYGLMHIARANEALELGDRQSTTPKGQSRRPIADALRALDQANWEPPKKHLIELYGLVRKSECESETLLPMRAQVA
jgi:hypothetical protein